MRNTRVVLILAAGALLWITLGWLATNPVVGNHQELRVMVKAGMQFEGTLRQHVLKWDRPEDLNEYSILRTERAV